MKTAQAHNEQLTGRIEFTPNSATVRTIDLDSIVGRHNRKVGGFFHLALELITTSINDIAVPPKRLGGKKVSQNSALQLARDAFAWFNRREMTPCGYGWCLSVTGANPNVLRARIMRAVRARERAEGAVKF